MTSHPSRSIGRYTLLGEIASGGMASVFLGRLEAAPRVSKRVAIKRLHPHLARDAEFLAMFFEEARLAARISSPFVVPVLDFITQGDEAILVMDYVPGLSLASLLTILRKHGERLEVNVVVRIVYDMLCGLHAAHSARDERSHALQIVHRDVSPQNVLIGEDGISRVVDFGIARAAGRLQITREGQLKGKLAYMAPEQLSGQTVDPRTDLFAAGIVMWESLTNLRLFSAEDDVATFRRVLDGEVKPPRLVRPDVPVALETVVMQALARERHQRPASAAAMAAALSEAVAPASPEQVAQWLRVHVGEALRAQSAHVDQLERNGPAAKAVALLDQPVLAAAQAWSSATFADAPTAPRVLLPGPPPAALVEKEVIPRKPDGRAILLTAAAIVASLGLALAWSWLGSDGTRGPKQAPAGVPQPAATVPAAAVEPPNDAKVAPRADKPSSRFSNPSSAGSSSRSSGATRKHVSGTARSPQTAHGPRLDPARDDCKVPFTIDASGVRIPKRHCL